MKKRQIKDESRDDILKKKSRLTSIKEGSAYALSDGAGMRYITPYALSLGANNAHIGILSSLPTLVGQVSQLFTLKYIETQPRKKIVFIGALLQAAMWLFVLLAGALFYFGYFKTSAPVFLIAVYTLLTVFGASIVPAWISWMRDIVPFGTFGHYFSGRSRIVGTVTLLAMLGAGFLLDYFRQTEVFFGFAMLFSAAFIARIVSAFYLKSQYEPRLKLHDGYYFSIWQFGAKMAHNNFGRFTLFVSLLHFGAYIASPFFAVYMLKKLGFSYLFFTIVMLSSTVSTLLSLKAWGRFSDKYGTLKTMKICGYLIPLVPVLWFCSYFFISLNPYAPLAYLIAIEMFSGFLWAGFNLATSNFIMEDVTQERVPLCVAYYNIFLGLGMFIGGAIGGIASSLDFTFFGLSPMLFIFLASGLARLIPSLFMLPMLKETRNVRRFGLKEAKELAYSLTPSRLLRILK